MAHLGSRFAWAAVAAQDKLRFSDATGFLGLEVLEGEAADEFYRTVRAPKRKTDEDCDVQLAPADAAPRSKKAKKATKLATKAPQTKNSEHESSVASEMADDLPRIPGGLPPPPTKEKEDEDDDELPDLDMTAWNDFGLHPLLIKGLQAQRFGTPTLIQVRTLPVSLKENRDVIGSAETGSGKTLAFGLPIMHKLLTKLDEGQALDHLQALILTPTRELALQVRTHLAIAAKYTPIKIAAIVGGLSHFKQQRHLDQKPHIIVATPGRLWELLSEMKSPYLNDLSGLAFLVLDEADRMVEQGHFAELDKILAAIDQAVAPEFDFATVKTAKTPVTKKPRIMRRGKEEEAQAQIMNEEIDDNDAKNEDDQSGTQRQTFVFSATITLVDSFRRKLARSTGSKKERPDVITTLVDRIAFRAPGPRIIHAEAPSIVAATLTEAHVLCNADEKELYLYYFIMRFPGRTVVFVNSISTTKKLLDMMRLLCVPAHALHAQMQQRQRLTNFDRFKSSPTSVLIATDVAARGLDVPEVDHVVHFHLPRTFETYVHRSGRTARASRQGFALSLVGPAEIGTFKRINQLRAQGEPTNSENSSTTHIGQFPIEQRLLSQLKKRVSLAERISNKTHSTQKKQSTLSWLAKQAREMDVELDDDLKRDQEVQISTSKSVQQESARLKKELEILLAQPIVAPQVQGMLHSKAFSLSETKAMDQALNASAIVGASASKESAITLARFTQHQSKHTAPVQPARHGMKKTKRKSTGARV